MTAEEWRPVAAFALYRVSSLGRVESQYRGVSRILRATPNTGGYPKVHLWRDGVPHPRQVHRLVIEAFRGERPEGHQTRHLNGNRLDARIENLAYGTPVENAADQTLHGTHYFASRDRCIREHLFTEANTRITPTGARRCRACDRIRQAESRSRRALRAAGVPQTRAA